MANLFEPVTLDLQESIKVEITKATLLQKFKKSFNPLYIFLSVYLLIPILSIESLIIWSISISCAYKTINIYGSEQGNKWRQAKKLQIIALLIIVIYNFIVYYVTKTFVW